MMDSVVSRRQMFQQTGMGIGGLALSSLMARDAGGALPQEFLRHAPKAKNVIYIHLIGGPSHLDLFDHKPELQKRNGEKCPDEFFVGKKLAFIRDHPKLLGTEQSEKFGFTRCGTSGLQLSNMLPHLQTVADEMCVIKTMHTEQFNHAPAQMFLQSGFARFGRPTMGAWVNYGLGSANENLPGFVVMVTGQYPGAGNSIFGSGFLPSVYQGVEFRSQGDPVLFLSNPKGVDRVARRRMVDQINRLNQVQLADVGDPEIATRISQYELAYRMQASVPELMEIKQESAAVHEAYGTNPGQTSFANNCLLARRLVERGVRFVQLFDQGWDHHGSVFKSLPSKCKQVDQPIAALIHDLKDRGLLDETLVIWGSEFGRTPMAQGGTGRDHHNESFAMWMAGGGVKPGISYGQTDELGYRAVENKVHVHDFNATVLHLLGMNHEKLTFKFQGRPYRLTDVAGDVIHDIIA